MGTFKTDKVQNIKFLLHLIHLGVLFLDLLKFLISLVSGLNVAKNIHSFQIFSI